MQKDFEKLEMLDTFGHFGQVGYVWTVAVDLYYVGGNLKIIHHKDQHFMFLKIFLQFTKLYCSSQF